MNKFVVLALAAAIAGCAVGPNYKKPAPPAAGQFSEIDQTAYSEAAPVDAFWKVFNDATLDDLMNQAQAANHDLRVALARLNEARAVRREVQFDRFPTVTAEGGRTETSQSLDQKIPGTPRRSGIDTGSFDAFWELDFFGRVRRNVQASDATEQALHADLRGVQVSVAAELARTYFELRGAQEQLAVAMRNADNQKATLAYAQARLDAGRGTEFDTARAQAQLNTTLSTVPPLRASVENTIHALSVLVGQTPDTLQDLLRPVVALPELPRITQIGTAADLLRRRPDIRAAERRLAAATARIGVATADLFPRVSFSGEIGFAADGWDRRGKSDTETWSYGPSIQWAAFDLGRVEARIGQAKAQADGSLALYQQTVLRALEETEDALTTYGETRRQLDYLQAGAAASDRAAALAHLRFEAGSSDFLDVLDAERTQLEATAKLAQSRTDAATSLVAVYKALGGSWKATAAGDPAASR